MGRVGTRSRIDRAQIVNAIDDFQPLLALRDIPQGWILEGRFEAKGATEELLGTFKVRIELQDRYPNKEPIVFETDGRIPRDPDRHVNKNGSICYGIWEEWLFNHRDWSISSYFEKCLRPYFLSQIYFEHHKKWPGQERAHYRQGILEAARVIIEREGGRAEAIRTLGCLSKRVPPRGHWLCPCNSGKMIRHCCKERLWRLYQPENRLVIKMLAERLEADE